LPTVWEREMSEKLIFDNLSYGAHFKDEYGTRYIKLNLNSAHQHTLPCYLNEQECNRTYFNVIDYNGGMFLLPFDLPVTEILNPTLDIVKKDDIISPDLNNSQTQNNTTNENNMKTNDASTATAAVSTTPQLTLKEAVVNAVNELKVKGSFSAHDVTKSVRDAANAGEIALPGLEASQPNSSNIKYWVNHADVKTTLDGLLNDGTLANLGLTNVDYSGAFRVFEFTSSAPSSTAPVPSADDHDGAPVATTPAPNVANPTQSPLAQKIEAYLNKVGSATLKQVQSALKVNGVTCKDLAPIVESLGFTVTAGTPDCFSTYTAN
jgi:hypothetical protein